MLTIFKSVLCILQKNEFESSRKIYHLLEAHYGKNVTKDWGYISRKRVYMTTEGGCDSRELTLQFGR